MYDSETAKVWDPGVELHMNYSPVGLTKASPDGELPTDRVSRYTLEPHIGLLPWLEAGAYLQTALRPDGRFDYAGVKLRWKARLPFLLAGHFGLALNLEVSWAPRDYDAPRYGGELRPIADARWRRLYASVNPILAIDFAGAFAGQPQLQPAFKVAVTVGGGIALGGEYYSSLGPIHDPFPGSEQVHRFLGVVDVQVGRVTINLGAGYAIGAGERWLVKSILAVDFGRR